MKALIVDFDIFATVGGGQTVYRGLFTRNPRIEFYYFSSSEPANSARPANAHPIPLVVSHPEASGGARVDASIRDSIAQFAGASNIASSVAGRSFDIVEVPDYRGFGGFLGPALRDAHVAFDKLAVSLHGRISKAIDLNGAWFHGEADTGRIAASELHQYETADIRYGVSHSYLGEWRAESPLPAQYLNPLWFLTRPTAHAAVDIADVPTVNYVGRFEKWKGPDLFVDLIWRLPRTDFSHARLIGLEAVDYGVAWGRHVQEICDHRQLAIDILPAMSRHQLDKLFSQTSITVVPSRWDTLNIVAIESLLAGCPTVISDRAGAHQFLRETFPDVPFVSLNPQFVHTIVPQLHAICTNYQNYRDLLVRALDRANPAATRPDLEEIYNAEASFDIAVRRQVEQEYAEARNCYWAASQRPGFRARRLAKRILPPDTSRWWRARRGHYKQRLREMARSAVVRAFGARPRVIGSAARLWLRQVRRRSAVPAIATNASDYRALLQLKAGQAQHWRRLAGLEQQRGNAQVAAAYWLRWARLSGNLAPNEMETTCDLLLSEGFTLEARVAKAMYGASSDEGPTQKGLDLLEDARQRNVNNPAQPFELIDDRRGPAAFRAAIIVSLYAAESKLELFLESIKHQTLFQTGGLELILIDSGSPTLERKVFCDWAEQNRLPVVYARSTKRETIQAAWNRGIALAHSEYLAFLGVDEMLVPGGLEVLARELDRNSQTDWVQSNTVVTNVDEHGAYVDDVMVYDRTGYQQGLVYLETCYLSWVGALYRRRIHERWGYYDSTFRAAGDTEFKNRVLPRVNTKHVPQTLGYFLNYPEDRTTASPRAEIEDLRAWYLHRSAAGIEYAWRRQPLEDAEATFFAALCYRKSFTRHWSTDIEYAANLGRFLQRLSPRAQCLRFLPGLEQLLLTYRQLDTVSSLEVPDLLAAYSHATVKARLIELKHRSLKPVQKPVYSIRNDNRYEQHTMIWAGDNQDQVA